ncbi:hypothetical protein FOZ61_007221 [Perkinsus olseni]|uniref:Methyltransferase type 11 domain-containing protein n=2 Tax=Perkinsus olseni TaxID=32597 RepID=A0A7J6LA35_PEROL|nr:hypothetical protein FOZ61_007221 [Perkinsus olseni]
MQWLLRKLKVNSNRGRTAILGVFWSAGAWGGIYYAYHKYQDSKTKVAFLAPKFGVPPEEHRLAAFRWVQHQGIDRGEMGTTETRADIEDVRRKILRFARGHVLECGIGTGRHNLRQYIINPRLKSLTGIDLVDEALDKAVENLNSATDSIVEMENNVLDVKPKHVSLIHGDFHKLPFPDNTFDTVVSSFALCSAEEPKRALLEMARVSRNRVLLLEHGLSCWKIMRWLGYLTGAYPDPEHPWTHGCYQDRDILKLCRDCGLTIIRRTNYQYGHVYEILAKHSKQARERAIGEHSEKVFGRTFDERGLAEARLFYSNSAHGGSLQEWSDWIRQNRWKEQ